MVAKTMESEAKLGIVAPARSADAESDDDVKAPAKERRITKKDWAKVESFLKEELLDRKTSDFRKMAERKWKEVDRQIEMEPLIKVSRDGAEPDMGWHNVIELGELSKASENIAADIRRIVFPQSRFWNEPHADIDDSLPLNPMGQKDKNPKLQESVNGRVRAFMSQQHEDFGLKDRVELSIKEALHHGSFVVEADWSEQELIFGGTKTKTMGSPVWIPHSMWNCYPDPSSSVIGTNMFYEGSMFVESYMPRHKTERLVKNSKDDGWMPSQWKKVSKDTHVVKDQKTKDVKLTTFVGDINIERADGDLYFPNHKAILANGTIVYMAPSKLPHSPYIYKGYERFDVRDPYYLSPIIKQSPMQKMATMLGNKIMDGVELQIEPPIVYDGNDPDFVVNGGPIVAPGSKTSTKGSNAFSQVQIGDLGIALQMFQLCLNDMKEKLGRPGKPVGDRATAREVQKSEQDQEASLIGFIDKLEIALRSFLYMQHKLNLDNLDDYSFYSPEMDDPDFLRIKRADLPKEIHFSVVGGRGVLGEQERSQKMSIAAAFLLGNEHTAAMQDGVAISKQMYQDAGVKNPERLLVVQGQESPEQLKAQLGQAKQIIQKLGQAYQKEKEKSEVKMAKIHADSSAKHEKLVTDHNDRVQELRATISLELAKLGEASKQSIRELKADLLRDLMGHMVESSHKNADRATQVIVDSSGQAGSDISTHMKALTDSHAELIKAVKKPRKLRHTKGKDGSYTTEALD
jgi:hypothetical protein